ncbi:uncharacterized protein A4U43_C08F18370 [Asparagus officinalis]|nr:uncharacterized protein A4U43_C08F18370 [Asparagus officinalis]
MSLLQLRFSKINKYISNTNVFEHSGRIYSIAENHIPQEVDIFSLEMLGTWDLNKASGSGELVIVGADAVKVTLSGFRNHLSSADGRMLKHLKLERSIVCRDKGVTNMYNIILDFPITVDINRLIQGGPLMKYDEESHGRIGVMPRYGDADSVKWFEVSLGGDRSGGWRLLVNRRRAEVVQGALQRVVGRGTDGEELGGLLVEEQAARETGSGAGRRAKAEEQELREARLGCVKGDAELSGGVVERGIIRIAGRWGWKVR